jgi:hypothetical protein
MNTVKSLAVPALLVASIAGGCTRAGVPRAPLHANQGAKLRTPETGEAPDALRRGFSRDLIQPASLWGDDKTDGCAFLHTAGGGSG